MVVLRMHLLHHIGTRKNCSNFCTRKNPTNIRTMFFICYAIKILQSYSFFHPYTSPFQYYLQEIQSRMSKTYVWLPFNIQHILGSTKFNYCYFNYFLGLMNFRLLNQIEKRIGSKNRSQRERDLSE